MRENDYESCVLRRVLIAGGILLGIIFITSIFGCTEGDNTTFQSPTIPCCTDTCEGVHTCNAGTGCEDDCADEPENTDVWVCHNGNSRKVKATSLAKHLAHGDTKGKCQPNGDDDDDDGDDDDHGDDADDNGDKVCICHIPPGSPDNLHTICISESAVPAHIRNHGDYLGECVK